MHWKTLTIILAVLVILLITGLRYDYRVSNIPPPQDVQRPEV